MVLHEEALSVIAVFAVLSVVVVARLEHRLVIGVIQRNTPEVTARDHTMPPPAIHAEIEGPLEREDVTVGALAGVAAFGGAEKQEVTQEVKAVVEKVRDAFDETLGYLEDTVRDACQAVEDLNDLFAGFNSVARKWRGDAKLKDVLAKPRRVSRVPPAWSDHEILDLKQLREDAA